MVTSKKAAACLLVAAVIWNSLPWPSLAAANHSSSSAAMAHQGHFTAFPLAQWRPEHWEAVAGAVNKILRPDFFETGDGPASGNPLARMTPEDLGAHLAVMMSEKNPSRVQAAAAAFILRHAVNPRRSREDLRLLGVDPSNDPSRRLALHDLLALNQRLDDAARSGMNHAAAHAQYEAWRVSDEEFDGLLRRANAGILGTPWNVPIILKVGNECRPSGLIAPPNARAQVLLRELRRRNLRKIYIDFDDNFAPSWRDPSPRSLAALTAAVNAGLEIEIDTVGDGSRIAGHFNRMPLELRNKVRLAAEGTAVVGHVGHAPLGEKPTYEINPELSVRVSEEVLDWVNRALIAAAQEASIRQFTGDFEDAGPNDFVVKTAMRTGRGVRLKTKNPDLVEKIAASMRAKLKEKGLERPDIQTTTSSNEHVDVRFSTKRIHIEKDMQERGLRPEEVAVSGDQPYPGGGDEGMFQIPGVLGVYSGPERDDIPAAYFRTPEPNPEGVADFLFMAAAVKEAQSRADGAPPAPLSLERITEQTSARRNYHLAFLGAVFFTQFSRFAIPGVLVDIFSYAFHKTSLGSSIIGWQSAAELTGTILAYSFSRKLHQLLRVGTAIQAALMSVIVGSLWTGRPVEALITGLFLAGSLLFAMNDFSAETISAFLTKGDDIGLKKLNAWQSFVIEFGGILGPLAVLAAVSLFGLNMTGLIAASAIIPAGLALAALLFWLMPYIQSDSTGSQAAGNAPSGPLVWLKLTPDLFKYGMLGLGVIAYVLTALAPTRQILPAGIGSLVLHSPEAKQTLIAMYGVGGAIGPIVYRASHDKLSSSTWIQLGTFATLLLIITPFAGSLWLMATLIAMLAALSSVARIEAKTIIQSISRKIGGGILELSNAFIRVGFKIVSLAVILIPSWIIATAQTEGTSLYAHPLRAFMYIGGGFGLMMSAQYWIAHLMSQTPANGRSGASHQSTDGRK